MIFATPLDSHGVFSQLKRIGECNNIPMSNMYVETNTNKTFPGTGAVNVTNPLPTGATTGSSNTSGSGAAANGSGSSGDAAALQLPLFGAVVAAGFAALGALF